MRILLANLGSHGDVLPFLSLARGFVDGGHEAIFFGNPRFQREFRAAGVAFVPVGQSAEHEALLANASSGTPAQMRSGLAQHMLTQSMRMHAAMREHLRPGATIAVDGSLVFPARLLAETDGVPCAVAHVTPGVLRSALAPARLDPRRDWLRSAPLPVRRLGWLAKDLLYNETHYNRPFNRLRAGLGLPPVRRMFKSWVTRCDVMVGLFPAWFAPPPADWPAHLALTGFPMQDLGGQRGLPPELKAFLAEGPPPVVFTAGTAFGDSRSFFRTAVTAAGAAGLRAVLVAHGDDDAGEALPPSMIRVHYAPFSQLLPGAAALVHHGGIGTTSQALRSGVPQLIRPAAYDQFDNSARAVALGVARELLPQAFAPENLAAGLRALLSSHALRERCREVRGWFTPGEDAIGEACAAILARGPGRAAREMMSTGPLRTAESS